MKEGDMSGARSTHGRDEKDMQSFVSKSEGKRPLGISSHRWEDIRMDIKDIGWEGVDWIHLTQDRDQWRAIVNTVMNLRVP
jgi:hypothetical protein